MRRTGPHDGVRRRPAAGRHHRTIPDRRARPSARSPSPTPRTALLELADRLAGLQERLYAQSTAGDPRSVLLMLQGMDTAGKDGVIEHVVGMVDPEGVRSPRSRSRRQEELAHDFLWRIEKQVPPAGFIGVFNRSQYEDVLVVRVHDLVPRERVVRSGTTRSTSSSSRSPTSRSTLVKCFLHISKEVQNERLLARLDDPTKYWKYNPGDVDERRLWDAYQEAYSDALSRLQHRHAPWHVIPSDRKWYRNWAVAALLAETLETLDPRYPPADFDIETERKRIAAS